MASRGRKRQNEIDLTGDSDDDVVTHRPKAPRSANSSFRSSQPAPSSQNHGFVYVESDDEEQGAGEVIASSQDDGQGADAENVESYGTLSTKIVGLRYYHGYATIGERVVWRREPQNQYDKNAIRVDNVQGEQIGHIPRTVAAKLAPYLDARDLTMDATLSGERNEFDCPLRLDLFGTSVPEAKQALQTRMTRDRLPTEQLKRKEQEKKEQERKAKQREQERKKREKAAKAAELKRVVDQAHEKKTDYVGTSSVGFEKDAPDMEELMEGAEHFNPREVAEAVEKHGASEEALAAMTMTEQPDRIATELLPYQRQGLAWLLEKENPTLPRGGSQDVVQLWKRDPKKADVYTNIATNFSLQNKLPKLASGAILADDMGLGKTLEVISLIVQDLEQYQPQQGSAATLIISPLSVMSNWSGQHVDSGNPLRVLTYHGSGKKLMKAKDFAEYDVVITTYGTLSAEYLPANKKKEKPAPVPRANGIFSVKWRRIVLDEGHNIRNPNTKGALAATTIQARSRLVLTGTPLVNNLKDLYSLVRFIGLSGGLERFEVFNSVLIRPANAGDPAATLLLQALMSTLCLRRRKDMAFVDLRLPQLDEYVHRIRLSAPEQEKYDALEAEARGLLRDFRAQHGAQQGAQHGGGREAQQTYRHLLEILLRLRQVCNHWKLCGARVTALLELLEAQKTVDLTPENRRALQDMLRLSIESREDCPICLEDLHNPVITHCAHVFGSECITRVIETQHKCPMCRAPLEDDSKLVPPAAGLGEGAGEDAEDDAGKDGSNDDGASSKVTALLSILAAAHKKAGTKVVVFSQWAKFLDLVVPHLEDAGYTLARIDGRMSAAARDASLRALDADPQTTILLATLGACSVGLNLTAASQVVLCDSWWAPAIEDQAIDRVHRLGQTRACVVWRLVVEGSVEERTLAIQAEKRRLLTLAFQEKAKRKGGQQARLGDIERLLA